MGTICAHPSAKDDCNETVQTVRRNLVQLHGTLANNISVDLTLGHYRQCKNQSLLVIIESKNLQHCDPLKDYTNDCFKTIQMIQNMRKTFFKPPVNKNCPYKKLFLCMMPNYKSEERDQYKQLFLNVLREALQGVKQIAIQFSNTIQGVHTLPNQLVMGLILAQLVNTKPKLKLNLITTEKKMMSFYRYELMKTQKFVIDQAKQ